MNNSSSPNNSSHRITERILDVFEYLTDVDNVGKTLTEISQHLGVPKSSMLPVLRTLVSRGYLYYNSLTHQHFLGYKLYEIGTKYATEENIDDVIYQIMAELSCAHNVTIQFGELVFGDTLFLQRVDMPEKLRLYKMVGRRLPAYSNALGKVLLAGKNMQELKDLYSEGLTPLTSKTITDLSLLYKEIEDVRIQGFARDNEEATLYVCSLAVPIVKAGQIIYGLQASVSKFEYSEVREQALLADLFKAKNKIENFI